MMSTIQEDQLVYVGTELELFAAATNWKSYWGRVVQAYVGANVLEVGAGIGSSIPLLCGTGQKSWLALEPDPKLADLIRAKVTSGRLPKVCDVVTGTLASLDPNKRFNTILYIDVLEHITDDRGELTRAAHYLADDGYMIVLSPALEWLFSPFDEAVGHCRRYTRRTLRGASPPTLMLERIVYLDSVGMLASLGNKLFLRSSHPTPGQIKLWDTCMVPISTWADTLLGNRIGKSIIGVWRKPQPDQDVA